MPTLARRLSFDLKGTPNGDLTHKRGIPRRGAQVLTACGLSGSFGR
jgi:hypothetical protein